MRTDSSPWWQVFVGFWIQALSIGSLVYAYGVVAVTIGEAFQPSRTMLMMGMAAMTLVSGLISPWLGAAVDRKSIRILMLMGMTSIGCGFLLMSMAGAMWQIPMVYALFMAFGYAMLGPLGASTLLSRWFTKRRGLAMGVAAMGTSFGGLAFPPLIQMLVDLYEWRVALRLIGLTVLALGVPVIWFFTVDRPSAIATAAETGEAGTADTNKNREAVLGARFWNTRSITSNRDFWIIALSVGIMFGAFTGTLGNLVPFARDLGIPLDQAALLMSIAAFMAIPGTLIFGAIADHVDIRAALAVIMVAIASGLLFFIGNPSHTSLMIGSFLVGIGGGGMIPVWSAMLARIFGAVNFGRTMGLMNPMLMFFSLLSPPLAGLIHDLSGSYHFAFLSYATALLLATLTLPLIKGTGEVSMPVTSAAQTQINEAEGQS